MSDLSVNSILDASGGATTTINGFTPTVSNMAGRNRIINGDMRIDQRNAGAALSNPANGFAVDRFPFDRGVSAATVTVQQSTSAPTRFKNSLLVTVGTGAATTSGDYSILRHAIEGYNVSDLKWGTAEAQVITLSFWVRSSLTGLFGTSIINNAGNRRYVSSYTINIANTWEYKTITIPGDTTGTWETNNSRGLSLYFDMGVGSTYSASAGSWGTGSQIYGLTGGVKLLANSGATFQLTGVQLEAGSVATPFEHRMYGQELALCQRYYRTWGGNSSHERLAVGFCFSTTQARLDIPLSPNMRTTPTLTISSASDWYVEGSTGAAVGTAVTLDQASPRIAAVNFNVASGLTAGQGMHIVANSTLAARFNLSAEL